MTQYLPEGIHIVADFYGVDSDILNDSNLLLTYLSQAAEVSGSTIISSNSHNFDPDGVTAFIILAESHISIHTYVSDKSAFIDVFTCGSHVNPELAIDYLEEVLLPDKVNKQLIYRGK